MFTGQKYHHSTIGVHGYGHHPIAAYIQNTVQSKPWYKNWPSKGEGVDHALVFQRGGFIIQRDNELRDLEAEMLRIVCNDVELEPVLLEGHWGDIKSWR